MNAYQRENERWQRQRPEIPLLRLVLASSEVTKLGMNRAALMTNFLLAAAVKAGRGGRGLWRCLTIHPSLVIRKGPNESVELTEEYRALRESVPPAPFFKF